MQTAVKVLTLFGGLGPAASQAVEVTQGETFGNPAHPARDLLIVVDVRTLQSSGNSNLYFRYIDFNNRWTVELRADGAVLLYERVAPAATTLRGNSSPGAVASGGRVVIDVRGGTYTAYQGGAVVWTYTDTSRSLVDETDALMASLATGAVYDIAFYPRTAANVAALGVG